MTKIKAKLNASADVTEKVNELTRKAALILREGYDGRILTNGFGIFADYRKRRDELQDARDAVVQALVLLENTDWPTEAEYGNL